MKIKREKFTVINNIACVVMLLAMIGTLLMPCWDYVQNIKTKDHTCEKCGYYLRAEKLESDFTCPNEVQKMVTTVVDEDGKSEEVKVVITEDTVVEEGATVITELCGAKKRDFDSETVRLQLEKNASVLDYTWLTFNHEDLTEHFENYEVSINELVAAPFLATLLAIFGLVFCALKNSKTWTALFPTASGIIMLCGLLMVPAYQLSPFWIYMVIAAAGLTLVSLVLLAQFVISIYKWCAVPVRR